MDLVLSPQLLRPPHSLSRISSRSKRELSSRSVHVAAPSKKDSLRFPFMTHHFLSSRLSFHLLPLARVVFQHIPDANLGIK